MAAELLPMLARAGDSNNAPLSGAKWKFYESGTTTPQAVYADATLETSLGSVVTADAAGKFVPIYFDAALSYRGVLESGDGSQTLYDIDPINTGQLSALFAEGGSELVGFLQDGTGAQARTVAAKFKEVMSIADFLPSGFTTAGGVNYTTHLQAAMNAAVDFGRILHGIDGIFDVSGTGLLVPSGLQFRGSGQDTCIIRNPNGNVLRMNGARYDFSDVYLLGAGGHVVLQTGDVNRSKFRRVGLHQGSAGYSLWNNVGHMLLANLWQDCYFQHLETATVPGFDISAIGGVINNNRWLDCWAQYSGNYVVRIDTTDANAQYGNIFDGWIFEVCSGGGIQLKGNKGFIINDCTNWDVDAGPVGEVVRDFYSILSATSGTVSYGRLSNCQRLASPLATGIYDLRLPAGGAGAGILIDSCTTPSAADPFLIEDAGNFIYVIAPNTLASFASGANATVLDPLGGALNLQSQLEVAGNKVVGSRVTGFDAMIGTANKVVISTYTAPDISNPPTEAEVQAIANALHELSQRVKAIDDALRSHGLIGS